MNNHEELETNRAAQIVRLPEAIKWPKEVTAAVSEYDAAYMKWVEAQGVLFEKVDAHEAAKKADAAALVEAIGAGKGDPGEDATNKTMRAVVFQNEATKMARKNADRQARAVIELLKAHKETALLQAAEIAEAGADTWADDIQRLKNEYAEAVTRRNAAYAPLRWVSPFVETSVRYEPSFPIEGSASWPQVHENRPRGIAEIIRKMLEKVAA